MKSLKNVIIKSVQNTRFVETRGKWYSEALVKEGKRSYFICEANGDTRKDAEARASAKLKALGYK